jgi:hypothetical protein
MGGAVAQVCESPDSGSGPASLLVNIKADGLGPNPFGLAMTATPTNVGGVYFIPAQRKRGIDAEAGLAFDRNPTSRHFGRLDLGRRTVAIAPHGTICNIKPMEHPFAANQVLDKES